MDIPVVLILMEASVTKWNGIQICKDGNSDNFSENICTLNSNEYTYPFHVQKFKNYTMVFLFHNFDSLQKDTHSALATSQKYEK
jgi:hypothetical protein